MTKSSSKCSGQRGFTVVELLIVVGIIAILAAFAGPSFVDFRDRAAIRAAANETQSVIDNARFEAVQRDRFVTVAFTVTNANVWCVGAIEGRVACDCMVLSAADAGFCSIDRYPAFNPAGSAADIQAPVLLRRVSVFDAPDFDGATSFVIDPKLGILEDPADDGDIGLEMAGSRTIYRARVAVAPLGSVRSCDVEYNGHAIFGLESC